MCRHSRVGVRGGSNEAVWPFRFPNKLLKKLFFSSELNKHNDMVERLLCAEPLTTHTHTHTHHFLFLLLITVIRSATFFLAIDTPAESPSCSKQGTHGLNTLDKATHTHAHTHARTHAHTHLHGELQVLAGKAIGLVMLLHLCVGVPQTPAGSGSTNSAGQQAVLSQQPSPHLIRSPLTSLPDPQRTRGAY